MFLADFHVHSNFSDGQLSISELVDLFGSRGFGAIAITDHLCEEGGILGRAARYLGLTLTPQNFPKYLGQIEAEADRAWDQYQMVVMPGFELSKNHILNKRSAHILALGTTKFLWANDEPDNLCKQIRSQGGLAIAAHPVSTQRSEKQTYYLWDRREELRTQFDAWEVASGDRLFREVLTSGLPMIASSDLHKPTQMTSWKTMMYCERHPEAIMEAIRNQDIGFQFYRDPFVRSAPLAVSRSAL